MRDSEANSETPVTPSRPTRVHRDVLSSGIIPVRFTEGRVQYLLLRVYSYWDFPKGVVLRNEDPLIGAIRELEEETALRNPKFKWGKDFRETPKYARGKTARYYIAELKEGDVELRPNPFTGRLEHHEFAWFDYEEARELVSPRVKPIFEWAHDKITSEKV